MVALLDVTARGERPGFGFGTGPTDQVSLSCDGTGFIMSTKQAKGLCESVLWSLRDREDKLSSGEWKEDGSYRRDDGSYGNVHEDAENRRRN